MPRKTIYVTQGEAEYVGGIITETSGKDISADTIVLALGGWSTPPLKSTGVTPSDDQPQTDPSTRIPKLLIDNTYPPASDQYCWAWLTDNPEIEPIMLDGPIAIV